MQPCQSETSNYGDETVPSSPPAETPKVRFAVPFSEELFPGTFEARVAPVLKAETGFSSYEAYLRENGPRHLQPPKKGPVFRYVHPKMGMKCAIIDMSKEKHLPPKVSLRCADYSVTQTFMVLREPPRGVSVRVVLCSASGYTNLAEFRNVFGVGMQLARQFFDALLAQLTRHSRFEVSNNARFRCKYLLASGTVVAVARHFALAPHESPPIVLVAGPPGVDDLIDEGALNGILNDGQRKESLLDEDFPSGSGEGDSSYSATFNYARLLSASMKQDPDYIHSCDELLLGSLIPLLQFDILRIRRFCSQAREYFVELKSPVYRTNADDIIEGFAPNSGEDDAPDELYRYRTILRSVIEQFEDETEPLKEFISSQIGEHMTSSLAYSRTEEDRKRVLREASRLEAEIRDYVQVQAGKLALLESRKSIELSSYQIQEGKRGSVPAFQDQSSKLTTCSQDL